MSRLIHRLNWKAHSNLEKSLGYPANQRWVAWHWEPELNQALYTDGEQIGTSNELAWQVFLDHPQINTDLNQYPLAKNDNYWLLLDRKTRAVYVGEGKFVQGLLENPESLGLLATLDQESNPIQDSRYAAKTQFNKLSRWTKQQQWLKLVPVGIAAALITSFGLSLFKSQNQVAVSPVEPVIETGTIVSGGSCGVNGSGTISTFYNTSNSDQELHLISVYEANSNHSHGNHPTGMAEVKITRQDKPIVLALSSYEPVKWQLKIAPGVQIEKIILNGYHDQQISGISGVPVEEYSYQDTGNYLGNFPYRWENISNSSSSPGLVNQLNQLTGTPLTSFQGCYRGTQFKIQ
ncbi:MAG: hypothetical protein WBA77_21450 [Microcoleaceae cyanobacterium]